MNYRRAENLLRSVIPRRQGMRPAGCSEEASTPWLSREKLPPHKGWVSAGSELPASV